LSIYRGMLEVNAKVQAASRDAVAVCAGDAFQFKDAVAAAHALR
jgi:hypothetical protein